MKRLSLRHQLGAIFLGFLLLVLSSVAVTSWLAQTQQNDAALINLAGRQRMLAQQMARLALTDPDDLERDTAMARFEQTLSLLANGGEMVDSNGRSHTLPAPTDPAIRAHLDEIAAHWLTFRRTLQPPVNDAILAAELDKLLGKLDALVGAYEAAAQTKISRLRGVQITFLTAAFLLLAGGYRIVQRQLLRPLATLSVAAQEIGSGNLETPVPSLPGQEFGRLGQTMETMRGEIAAQHHVLEQQVTQRTAELTAAFAFSQEIVRELEPSHLLQVVADHTRSLMRGDAASLCVLDGDGRALELVANSGGGQNYLGLRQSTARGLALPVIQERETVLTEGGCANCGFLTHFPGASCLAAPLQVGGRSLGALCVVRPQHPFDNDEARALTLMANAAAVALENARLIEMIRRQTEENAALAERERLAANLHDNLAQTLGAMHLRVDLLAQDVANGETELAQQRLGELQANLQQAYAQVRMALTGLREPSADEAELTTAVQTVLADFSAETNLPVQLNMGVGSGDGLTAVAQKQLLHILRESLTNIRRHAQATQVTVTLTPEDAAVTLTITDDGVGFNRSSVNDQHHLGLTIMRMRAERSQGQLTIDSAPGLGTRITAVFPTTQVHQPELESA